LFYYDALNDIQNQLIVGIGPAGCGKTLFACQTAIKELNSKSIKKIVITRPLISVEKENVGFLPGDMNEKMDPWSRPIIDVLNELSTKEDVEKMIQTGIIELSPLAYMRGRTFKNSFIIADEMQNSSPSQMQMLTTRIGTGSKMVINGDLQQSDYSRGKNNGLNDLLEKLDIYNKEVPVINTTDSFDKIFVSRMDETDVHRSSIVSKVLDIYNYNPNYSSLYNDNSNGIKGRNDFEHEFG
jgi:phosphate starvation-inducible PhoH-like protein